MNFLNEVNIRFYSNTFDWIRTFSTMLFFTQIASKVTVMIVVNYVSTSYTAGG